MTAVLDTSPLCYLLLIEEAHLLPALFETVVLPAPVRTELLAPGSPEIVRTWMQAPPAWLQIAEPPAIEIAALQTLGAGERGAIALGTLLPEAVVVLDEKAARRVARDLGLTVTGLLGILDLAAARGQIDLATAVQRLRQTSFRASPALLASLLRRQDPGEPG